MMEDEFFELVDDEVLDEYLEAKFGYDAHETIEIPDMTKVEAQAMAEAFAAQYNESLDNGEAAFAGIMYRFFHRILDLDEDIRERYEEAQRQSTFGGFMAMNPQDDPFR